MKKNIIIMALIAASSIILAVSCQKEMLGPGVVSEKGKTFTATIEQDFTKTTLSYDSELGESKVLWESDDCININGSGYAATPLNPATKAIFKDKWWGEEPTAPYHAIFPASLHNGSGFEFPVSQEYAAGKFNVPMYAESSTEVLPFKNICGVLCFSLKGEDKVKRISVTANEPLCGAFTISNGYEVNLTGTGKTVTLYCGQEGVQLDSSTPTDFYIYLPPGKYTSGMRITITDSEEDVFEKITTADAGVDRNTVYTFDWNVTFSPALTGQFSIGEDRTVSFSQGNLHATKVGENWITGFYERQMEVNPIATVNGARTASSGDKEIDLFTWGYNSGFTTDPTTLSYGQVFFDWGTKIGSGGTWRTLSGEEWNYLLKQRSNADKLYKTGVTVCGVEECLVIAPDGFAGQIAESYDATGWSTAEKTDGLVCLPPAGHRYGVGIGYTGRLGFYWAANSSDGNNACSLSLSKEGQAEVESVLYADAQEKKFNGWNDAGGSYSDEKVTEAGVDCYKISHDICDAWKAQFAYEDLTIYENAKYILTIKAKVSSGTYDMLPMLQNPNTWASSNASMVKLTTEWQEFKRTIVTTGLGYSDRLTFNIGDCAGDVYIAYVKLEKESTPKLTTENRILQGFPNGTGFSWGSKLSNAEGVFEGIYCHKMDISEALNSWDAKYQISFDAGTFEQGQKYRIRMKAKSSDTKSIICYFQKQESETSYPYCGTFPQVELTTEWQEFVIETSCTDSGATCMAFDIGDFAGSIYLAEIAVYNLVEIPYAASTEDGVGTAANNRNYGLSVRLVRDVNPAANLNSLNDNNDYGNLFN